ncbi:short-chain dehydrogenase [Mycolicibacter arupensis]|uniref:Short-chain dehydrogenase n=1 Tax=Mycolicibacter arupensis TaxID=342002 RepID=A0ABX3R9A7_9MYCO|nr:short-chain dehydrogenase [Mycolicibacter arupensis]OQZ90498.1 short-chain dehydrogenase [Mycolicibacter arupensis]
MRFLPFGSSPGRTHRAHAVVTGAGSGIGRAFAVELARRGGRVVCAEVVS